MLAKPQKQKLCNSATPPRILVAAGCERQLMSIKDSYLYFSPLATQWIRRVPGDSDMPCVSTPSSRASTTTFAPVEGGKGHPGRHSDGDHASLRVSRPALPTAAPFRDRSRNVTYYSLEEMDPTFRER